MSDELDIQNALRDFAAPIPDNGFVAATLKRSERIESLRIRVLAAATCAGGLVALSQTPSLWKTLAGLNMPTASPLALTALGLLGFVGWAALDRGWSDAV